MSVEVRAHIGSPYLQERAVLRATTVESSANGRYCRAVSIQGRNGDAIRISLIDLGEALRVLKVSAADLGYKPRAARRDPLAVYLEGAAKP